MHQKLILVTGATDGIGKQTALELARGGARLLLHGRSRSKLEATRDELQRLAPRARIVNVSSMAHLRGVLDFENLRAEKDFTPYGAYALSKLGNVLFTVELARRLREPITVNARHPGVVATKLLVEGLGMQGQDSLSQSAATSVYLASAPEIAEVSGRYFVRGREAEMHPMAAHSEMASRLYELSAELAGIRGLPAA